MEEAKAAFAREVEIDPHNSLVLYKLGTLEVEQGDGANGKASIEAALEQDPNLKNASYYLGRAEAELGNDTAAVEALKRAVSAGSDPAIAEQAWYQLGIVYRKMQRPEEAQKALETFQKLKNEEAARQQGRAAKALGIDSAATGGAAQNPQ
jgi:tetratricopeptide (TPR) repeat protein